MCTGLSFCILLSCPKQTELEKNRLKAETHHRRAFENAKRRLGFELKLLQIACNLSSAISVSYELYTFAAWGWQHSETLACAHSLTLSKLRRLFQTLSFPSWQVCHDSWRLVVDPQRHDSNSSVRVGSTVVAVAWRRRRCLNSKLTSLGGGISTDSNIWNIWNLLDLDIWDIFDKCCHTSFFRSSFFLELDTYIACEAVLETWADMKKKTFLCFTLDEKSSSNSSSWF